MKGICFKEPLFHAVTKKWITQFCEIMNPQPLTWYNGMPLAQIPIKRYKVCENVYLKEPYYVDGAGSILHKFDNSKNSVIWKKNMPEMYARYFIEITCVKCERLQNISNEDCEKEGVLESDQKGVFYTTTVQYGGARAGICKIFETPQLAYAALIDKINGKGTWDKNPFVWVYEFKLVE